MTRKRAPSAQKTQELAQWLEGQSDTHSGEALWSALIRLSTERVLQEALEQAQAEALGRGRDERQPIPQGYRNGYEDGTVQTAAGVFRLPLPPGRGLRALYRSQRWAALGWPSEVLTRLIVEMDAGGMAQRDMEGALAKALGQCVVSQRAVSDMTERLSHGYEVSRARDRRSFALAYRFLDTVYEP
jgi:transposase-like protein